MNKKRILIVDDDQDILRMLEFGLKKLGPEYEIYTARDIYTAMNRVEQHRFDLILTDYMMPGMTGVDLARAARRMSPDTRVVLMTAYGTSKLRSTTDHLGFDGYLNKPFTMDQVRDIVQHTGLRIKPSPAKESRPENVATTPPPQLEPSVAGDTSSVELLLEQLQINAGTRGVLLINSTGAPICVVGQLDSSKVAYISRMVASNFYASAELSNFIDNQAVFGATFYEGDNYNLYVCDVNDKFLLTIIFDSRLRPGAVWFYAKQTAAALAPLLA